MENIDYSKSLETIKGPVTNISDVVEHINKETLPKKGFSITEEFFAQEILHNRVPNYSFEEKKGYFQGKNLQTESKINIIFAQYYLETRKSKYNHNR